MSEMIQFHQIENGTVEVRHTFDNSRVSYDLEAKINNVDDILLKLMDQYSGACTLPYESQLEYDCDSMCENCPKSIFYQVAIQQRQYRSKANILLDREVKEGDRWEVSYVFNYGRPYTNHTFLFTCLKTTPSRRPIIPITADFITSQGLDVVHGVKSHFFKIQRFDMPEAMDCSGSGRWRLVEELKSRK